LTSRYIRLSCSALLSVLFASSAHAGPLTGRVVDPDGRPVAGASVLLVRGPSVLATIRTDTSGAFTLAGPDSGALEVRVAVEGMRAQPMPVEGQAATRDLGTLALSIAAVEEAVLVSASQTDVPLSTSSSSVTVMTGEELAARQIDTLPEALRLIPGLTVATAGRPGSVTSVFPRGGDSDYSLVLIDGVQANAFGGGIDLAHLPLVNIDRIEVVRGPQSALYGANAIGSVIRVITKRGGPPSAAASIEGGSFDTARVTAATAGAAGAWQWAASVERFQSDGLTGDTTSNGTTIANDDYERNAFVAGAGWSTPSGATVRGDLHYIADERGAPGPFGSDPGGTYGGVDTIARGDNDRWLAAISAATASNARVRAQGTVTHSRIDGVFASEFGDSESASRRTTARFQADVAAVHGIETSVGVEVLDESARSTFITAGPEEVPVERGLAGFFGEARWSHDSRLYVTGGLRVERITRRALAADPNEFAPRPAFDDQTVVSTNPKIAAAWFVRAQDANYTKLRGSAGTGIRPPDAFEIAFTDNPDLQPERSRSFDLGIDQAFLEGRGLIEATAFFNEYDDLIVTVGTLSGASRYTSDNISNARARGFEVAGTGRMRWSTGVPVDLQVRVGYTLLDTEILAVDGTSLAPSPFVPGDRLLRRPRHQFATDVTLTSGRLVAFLRGGGRGDALDIDPSFGAFGGLYNSRGYNVWNTGASWRLARGIHIFGRIDNLFDREYEEVLGYPALPRGAMAGVRIAAGR
jgi:vitamin B12 transporter